MRFVGIVIVVGLHGVTGVAELKLPPRLEGLEEGFRGQCLHGVTGVAELKLSATVFARDGISRLHGVTGVAELKRQHTLAAMPTTSPSMLIAYYRVSSDRQGRSGLGLEAQRAIVEGYAVKTGNTVVASYTEVESGRRSDRPQLALALMRLKAQAGRARLIVAKLDRLSRDARFLLELVDSGVDVVFGVCSVIQFSPPNDN